MAPAGAASSSPPEPWPQSPRPWGRAGRFIGQYRLQLGNIDLPAAADPAPAFPDGIEGRFSSITPLRISNEDFYRVDTRLDTPIVNQDDWTLTIDGDVDREVTITYDELLAMPMIERDITMTCVSNSVGGKFVGGARWLGVRLTDLLDMAGVGSTADQIFSTDFDGMTISTPLDLATDGRDAMIAVGMNGEALPREHGFPARMIIPGLYGFISATKWVTRLTLTTYDDAEAYWTERDWATDAPIKVVGAHRHTARALATLDAGRERHRRRRLGPAEGRRREGAGPHRRRRLDRCRARRGRQQRLLASVVLPVAGRPRPAPGRSAIVSGDGTVQTAARAHRSPRARAASPSSS